MPSLSTGPPSPSDPYLDLLPDLMRTFTPAILEALIRGRFAIQAESNRGELRVVVNGDQMRLETTVNTEWYP